MNIRIISYSMTGNNDALAHSLAKELAAVHTMVTEPGPRGMGKIFFDMLFNRTPKVEPKEVTVADTDLVIFIAPVWMGHVASPLRAYFKQLSDRKGPYAFISISGGSDGANPKLADELLQRMGKAPAALIDMAIVDILRSQSKPTRKDTSAYRLTDKDVQVLTHKVMSALEGPLSRLNIPLKQKVY